MLCCAVLCRNFTDTALGISLVILNSMIDLVSFSGILYSIYPPLFAALLAYSIGGTVGSIWLGKVGSSGALPAAWCCDLRAQSTGATDTIYRLYPCAPQ